MEGLGSLQGECVQIAWFELAPFAPLLSPGTRARIDQAAWPLHAPRTRLRPPVRVLFEAAQTYRA